MRSFIRPELDGVSAITAVLREQRGPNRCRQGTHLWGMVAFQIVKTLAYRLVLGGPNGSLRESRRGRVSYE